MTKKMVIYCQKAARLRASGIFALLFIAAQVFTSAAEVKNFHPNRVLIIPKAGATANLGALHKKNGHKPLRSYPQLNNLQIVEVPTGTDILDAVAQYRASGLVESAEPDYLLTKSATPNDPNYSTQWHLNNNSYGGLNRADISAPAGWDVRHDATNVIVAIIDSGMRLTHEDLAGNLWTNSKEVAGNGLDDDADGYIDDVHGINAINGSGDPTDDDGHGTHVAGIIGAVGNNGRGVSGVAWKVQLMPLKFIDSTGNGYTSDGIECVNYAIKHGAKVINASFGGGAYSSSMQTAVTSARNAGIVFVAAAGNEKTSNDLTPSYPANYSGDNIISVCATTSLDEFDATYSNWGATTVHVGAPGTMIYSTSNSTNNNGYVYMSGTSMASPVVAGVVALMRAQFPNDTPVQIRQRLMATVDPLPSLTGKCVSGGRVNLQKALMPYVSAGFTPSAIAGAIPLTVRFTNSSVGDVASYKWNFGDRSELVTDASPSHTFTNEGAFTVSLTVTGTNGATSTITKQITVEPTYSYKSVAYEWIDPTGMQQFALADNGVTGAQALPFSIYFFGQPRSQIYIGANGLLGFDPANLSTTSNADIPSVAAPNGSIMPYWDNLNPAGGGAVYAGVVGATPNRRFVVSWVGVPRNSSADKMTFQAVLSETTGQIQFNYLEVNPTSPRGGGARATIGVEDSAGAVATKYCFDGAPNRVANGQSIAFVLGGTGGLTVTPDSASSFIGGALDLVTNVTSFTVANTSARPMLWKAVNPQPWITLSSEGGVLPANSQAAVIATVNTGVAQLAPGSYSDAISFVNLNNGQGDGQRTISVEVNTTVEARFNAPTLVNGVFTMRLPASVGEEYVIEASADLATWIEVKRGIVDASGVIPFSDTAASDGNRFFRAQVVAP